MRRVRQTVQDHRARPGTHEGALGRKAVSLQQVQQGVQDQGDNAAVKTNTSLPSSAANTCAFHPQNALQVHQRTHGDEKPYVCQYCMKGFREKGSLVRHVRHHTGEKPFKCPKCGRAFAEHGTLNRHMRAKGQCGAAVCGTVQDRFRSNDHSVAQRCCPDTDSSCGITSCDFQQVAAIRTIPAWKRLQ